MAKQYGVICDVCGNKIDSPGSHSVVIIREKMINYDEKFDVCPNCRGKIITFIKRTGENR